MGRHPLTPHTLALHYTGVLEVPAAAISLRAIDPERYAIVNEEDQEVIEEIEESKAFYEVYDGAVYMFQVGKSCCKRFARAMQVSRGQAVCVQAELLLGACELSHSVVCMLAQVSLRCLQGLDRATSAVHCLLQLAAWEFCYTAAVCRHMFWQLFC